MKTKTHHAPGLAGDNNAEPGAIKLTDGKSPLPSEILLNLGAMFAEQQVATMMGNESEIVTARGVIAGMIVTLHAILPPKQFRDVMVQWEIDDIKLSEILGLATTKEAIES